MKHRVNLYPADLRPKLEILTFNNVLVACLVLIVLVSAWRSVYQSQLEGVLAQQKRVASQVSSKSTRAQVLQEQLENRSKDPLLLARIDDTQQELDLKNRLLNEVKGREILKNTGFSSLMLALAENHNPDLWLTDINIDQQDLRFAGQTIDSAAVPKWLQQLGKSEFFQGKDFASTRLYREQDGVRFEISSRLQEEPAQGGQQ